MYPIAIAQLSKSPSNKHNRILNKYMFGSGVVVHKELISVTFKMLLDLAMIRPHWQHCI